MEHIDTQEYAHLTRQLDIIPVESLRVPVTIIGCGAIGSFAALALVKMGVTNLTLYDHDTVSIENMSNQFFMHHDIGSNKARALHEMLRLFTGDAEEGPMEYVPRKFGEQETDYANAKGIVIVAVDNMDTRRTVYESIKDTNFAVNHIIDPRMGSEHYAQYVINPHDPKDQATYEKTLYSDDDAVQERCTAKSTIYTAVSAGGMVAKSLKNIITKQEYPRIIQWNLAASNNPMRMYGSAKE